MRENERPFIDIEEFLEQATLLKQAMRLLKEHYFEYAAAKNGLISVQEMEPMFEKIITEMQPITVKEGDIIEGMFDSFLGALTMSGESDFAFHLIQTQFNLFGDVDDDEGNEGPSFNYATVNIREEIDGILWFRHSFDIEYDDAQEIFKVAENWIHENLMQAVWNNCHLEIVDHT
jgi:hypothetical protein